MHEGSMSEGEDKVPFLRKACLILKIKPRGAAHWHKKTKASSQNKETGNVPLSCM